ncbi:hypothetical protein P3X46_006373 [Hevea brasiliensis]|uniref:S-protein homolog n=1 Tax=Hevea brasiliensis TaxID=3981 RepID=A0ABQ9MQ04_HEVBR|nr:hypothetical protein P3X46_006373 [Hevea brasiliensis]
MFKSVAPYYYILLSILAIFCTTQVPVSADRGRHTHYKYNIYIINGCESGIELFSVNYRNNVGYHCDLARGFAHSQRRSIVAFDLSRDTDDLRCGRTGQCFWKVTEVAVYFGNNNSTWTRAYNWSSVASTDKDNNNTTQPRPWPKASLP